MTPNEKPPLFTELTPEKAASLNGGYYVKSPYYYCSKPWGAVYYPYYRPRSYSTSKTKPTYKSASFKSAATRLDAVLFE